MEHSPALPSTIVLWSVKGSPVMLDEQGGKPKSSRAPAYDCCDSRPDPFDRVLPLLSPNCVPENPPPRVRAGVLQPDRQRQPAEFPSVRKAVEEFGGPLDYPRV